MRFSAARFHISHGVPLLSHHCAIQQSVLPKTSCKTEQKSGV